MQPIICGIGTAVPPHAIDQRDAADQTVHFGTEDEGHQQLLRYVYQQTGIKSRHSVVLREGTNGRPAQQAFYRGSSAAPDRGPSTSARMDMYERHAAPLAAEAAWRALQSAATEPEQVSHLVTVSCTGFAAPGADLSLIADLPLRPDVQRTHVGFMGCHGALNGLRVANAFVRADPSACVLLCAVELCTLHLQYGFTMQRVISNALFADGAAALVCRAPAQAAAGWRIAAQGSFVLPDSRDAMTWRIGDHGFEMSLSPQVPPLIREHLGGWVDSWLAGQGLKVQDIGAWAIHPGGPKILQACCEALGIERAAVRVSDEVLAAFGNMSSPTLLFIVERLMAEGAPGPMVALGFGPGLVVEAALFE